MDTPQFPLRINRFLALNNYATRKGADDLIKKGYVFINGKRAVLGDKVNEKDVVEVSNVAIKKRQPYVYYAYNKPVGEETPKINLRGSGFRKGAPDRVFPLGRLDKDSHGLIILTNDGRITDKLLNPEYVHDKEYFVVAKQKLRPNFKQKMEAGVNIEGYVTKKCKVNIIDNYRFSITLTEGKKHQIRRMVAALFNEVADLKRTRIMNIELGSIPPGKHRQIEGKELVTFMRNLGF